MKSVAFRIAFSSLILGLSLCLPANATDVQNDTVVLGELDKVSGQVNTIKGRVGQAVTFGNLQIIARTCVSHPPEERPENSAFLEITQPQPKGPPKLLFSGWMFSSTPAISAMDNAVYDVWVLRCENSVSSNAH
ncbi:MAG: DUF2155 domain-containing protein [Rhodospirillaceae bacterium]|nr:MAG: DUF2155 domain-containing protein [Rhodospirillaceae bacterium]